MKRTPLDAILAPGGLRVFFQPILEVGCASARLHGFECLVRGPEGTSFENADVLFDYVRRKREESLVDRVCVALGVAAAGRLPMRPRIFLNVHASTLGRDHDFVAFLAGHAQEHGVPLTDLTIEIVEHTPAWDGQSFLRALADLRALGVRVGLDDIGLGQSNYRMILDTRPDYFKIDRYFTQGVASDFYRQAVMESVQMLARRFEAHVIAEGVEAEEDLKAVVRLGVRLAQGFLYSHPVPEAEAAALCLQPLAFQPRRVS